MKTGKLNIQVLMFLVFISIITVSCDPEFNYQFRGVVKSNDEILNAVAIEYYFLPEEKAQNWRANISDSIVLTDELGQFVINQSTVTVNFDSIKLSFYKDGYEKFDLISTRENWKSKNKIGKKDVRENLESINLIQIDSMKFCEIGTSKARTESLNNQLTHYEILKIGTPNLIYRNNLKKALNDKGISFKISNIFGDQYPSNDFFQNECYLKEMKLILEEKFGQNWLKELELNLNKEN